MYCTSSCRRANSSRDPSTCAVVAAWRILMNCTWVANAASSVSTCLRGPKGTNGESLVKSAPCKEKAVHCSKHVFDSV